MSRGVGAGEPGVIRWTVPGHARVLLDTGEEVDAVLPRAVRPESDPDSPVVVGDRAWCERAREGPVVRRVGARTTVLSRRASGREPQRQVIAANAELLVCVFSCARPEPRWGMLDRYLVIAESAGLSALVCMTKSELDGEAVEARLRGYIDLGYDIVRVSAHHSTGLDELVGRLRGRRAVLAGKSGVGKSTLLNALVPGAGQSIGEVGELTNKGRHTTTLGVLFPFEGGGWLVDTPGVREVALWGVATAELSHWFREMVPLLERCRFAGSCTHSHEVGCAVKLAVERGEVSRERYESYLRLLGGEASA